MKILLTMLLSTSIAFSQESVVLKKGQSAPFDGILSDADQMKEYRQINEEKKLLEIENIKLKDLALVQDQRVKLYQDEVRLVKEDLSSLESRNKWVNIGMFALGVIATGLAAKAAIESTRK